MFKIEGVLLSCLTLYKHLWNFVLCGKDVKGYRTRSKDRLQWSLWNLKYKDDCTTSTDIYMYILIYIYTLSEEISRREKKKNFGVVSVTTSGVKMVYWEVLLDPKTLHVES